MNSYSLTHLNDAVLLRDLRALLARDRDVTAAVLAHIAEVDARRLYAPAGFSSMFTYCLRELSLSEDAAWRRIQAARTSRRFPILFQALAEGRLNLTAVCLIAPHLTPENLHELVGAVAGRSRDEIRRWLASRFPEAMGVPPITTIRPVGRAVPKEAGLGGRPTLFEAPAPAHVKPTTPVAAGKHERDEVVDHVPTAPTLEGGDSPSARPLEARPLDAGFLPAGPAEAGRGLAATPGVSPPSAPPPPPSFLVQVTVSQGTHDKLRRAQVLLSHAVSSRDVAQVLDRALDALIEKLEKRKIGAASTPRAGQTAESTQPGSRASRHIPAAIRRAVWERDQGRCTFQSAGGQRCGERRFLEFDHIRPIALGGETTVEGLRLRCRAHNQCEADRVFGAEFMNRKRDESRSRRTGK